MKWGIDQHSWFGQHVERSLVLHRQGIVEALNSMLRVGAPDEKEFHSTPQRSFLVVQLGSFE